MNIYSVLKRKCSYLCIHLKQHKKSAHSNFLPQAKVDVFSTSPCVYNIIMNLIEQQRLATKLYHFGIFFNNEHIFLLISRNSPIYYIMYFKKSPTSIILRLIQFDFLKQRTKTSKTIQVKVMTITTLHFLHFFFKLQFVEVLL